MYDKERMKNIVQKMHAKKNEEETRYADALREIGMAYSEIPRFARKMKTLKFRVEGNYSVSMYQDCCNDSLVSILVIGNGRDAASINFATGSDTDYRKLSLAASKAVENARSIRPGLEWVLTHTDEFIGAMMEHLEKEYC